MKIKVKAVCYRNEIFFLTSNFICNEPVPRRRTNTDLWVIPFLNQWHGLLLLTGLFMEPL